MCSSDLHQPQRKELVDQASRHGRLRIHVPNEGADFPVGKCGDALSKQGFVVAELGQGWRGHS